jgi:hypothetical protein
MTRTTISAITNHCVDAPIDSPLRNGLNVIRRHPNTAADIPAVVTPAQSSHG